MLRFTKPLIAVLMIALAPPSFSNDQVDVESVILRKLGFNPNLHFVGECPKRDNCRNMCAQRPPCNERHELTDITFEQLEEDSMTLPDPTEIPRRTKTLTKTVKNCTSSIFKYEREVTVVGLKRMVSTIARKFSNVQESVIDISLDAKFLGAIGAKTSSKFTNKTTLDTSTDTASTNEEKTTIREPVKFNVPPKTLFRYDYSLTQYDTEIPLQIKGVVDAKKQHSFYIARGGGAGTLWLKRQSGYIGNTYPDKSLREVRSPATILIDGHADHLEYALYERPLSDEECILPPSAAELNATSESVIVQDIQYFPITSDDNLTLVRRSNEKNRDCEFEANLHSYDSSSYGDVSAIFSVEKIQGCDVHGGTVSFDVVVEEDGYLHYKEDYARWAYESEGSFSVEWQRSGYLSENERLVDITNIEVSDCFCMVIK